MNFESILLFSQTSTVVRTTSANFHVATVSREITTTARPAHAPKHLFLRAVTWRGASCIVLMDSVAIPRVVRCVSASTLERQPLLGSAHHSVPWSATTASSWTTMDAQSASAGPNPSALQCAASCSAHRCRSAENTNPQTGGEYLSCCY